MTEVVQNRSVKKQYDLEDRSEEYAKDVRIFARKIRITPLNVDDLKQLVRSAGSVGANYIEANGALGKKDFIMKIRTCKKEVRESAYWLRMLEIETKNDPALERERQQLHGEARELERVFGAILRNSTPKQDV